ncbi:MAG: DUF2780 domain-containing protein [Chitinispirillaceae bacterium]|nr:DUF2780 domain-containing protein [Chitinispirillaceae bacterium]
MADIISDLVSKLGIQESQAKGGAGLIFKLAQENLGGDFSKIATAIPDVNALISSAPQAGGAAKAIGGNKAKALTGVAGLAGGFSQLNLDSGMIAKFVPIILEFVKSKGGQGVSDALSRALKK